MVQIARDTKDDRRAN